METCLEAYNSFAEFDYGFQGLSLRDDDDGEEFVIEISDME